tara:strand:+ start:14106 stop:14414 length:309 start_codon:yes stop_codon:yes gene_type:complete
VSDLLELVKANNGDTTMKTLIVALFFSLLTAGYAQASQGLADRYNEAQSLPEQSVPGMDRQMLCERHQRAHESMKRDRDEDKLYSRDTPDCDATAKAKQAGK